MDGGSGARRLSALTLVDDSNDSEVPTNSQSRAPLPMLTLTDGLPSCGSRSVGNDVFGDADFAERSHNDGQREQLEQLERVAARLLRQHFRAERIEYQIELDFH